MQTVFLQNVQTTSAAHPASKSDEHPNTARPFLLHLQNHAIDARLFFITGRHSCNVASGIVQRGTAEPIVSNAAIKLDRCVSHAAVVIVRYRLHTENTRHKDYPCELVRRGSLVLIRHTKTHFCGFTLFPSRARHTSEISFVYGLNSFTTR